MTPGDDPLILFLDRLGATELAQTLRDAAASEALTPLAMFMAADWVVKAVMLGLVAASILAWAIWAGKLWQLSRAQHRLRRDYRQLAARGQLGPEEDAPGLIARMTQAARAEIRASAGLPDAGVKERVAIELARIEAGAARIMQAGVTVIGSIGATAPFIGLFGTVWGIMNAFVGIAQSGSSSLAVVAPGIAEALMATALGLVAAIPAVLLYNHLTRALGGYRTALADAAALVERTLSRDLDRARHAPPQALHLVAE
ncbi:outer membrane transport energization protein ExbB [Rhodobacter aestuarii]|uniref:Biopolymer transport protein ExbB n=1 Tax=Rhodobacter aestuarii TaxID=453582 RepID=A0A1N7JL70_9RHOB|nr:tonB-system energizer ExbB [Rhodobacter aestuarii]PTV96091.1 outer membrane transport energization protein ExbB [Rhodobacter aestuarii]SIS50060.1 outer membrane transport energization protein ExbB [Rhodobacter aestuarii]